MSHQVWNPQRQSLQVINRPIEEAFCYTLEVAYSKDELVQKIFNPSKDEVRFVKSAVKEVNNLVG